MKHQDKASWYQCAFRRLAFSTGSGSCQSTHFNPLNERSKWVLGSSGGHGILTHFFLESSQTIGVSLGFTTEKLNFSRPSLWNCGRVAGPPTASSMDPHPIHTKRIPKARLHVNASKFNSLNNVLKPKKKCFRTFLSTSNLVKIQLPTFPGNKRTKPASSVPSSTSPGIRLSRALKKIVEGWSLQWIIVIDVCSLYQLGNYNCNYKPPNVDHPSAMIRH